MALLEGASNFTIRNAEMSNAGRDMTVITQNANSTFSSNREQVIVMKRATVINAGGNITYFSWDSQLLQMVGSALSTIVSAFRTRTYTEDPSIPKLSTALAEDAGPSNAPQQDENISASKSDIGVATFPNYHTKEAQHSDLLARLDIAPVHCETYIKSMISLRNGYPLWYPQPNYNLPIEYRRSGISIGDVGIITLDGAFDFLFNVLLPSEHPVNAAADLPSCFNEAIRPKMFTRPRTSHTGASVLTNLKDVKIDVNESVNGISLISTDRGAGAILSLPDGASEDDMSNEWHWKQFIAENALSWYKYARVICGRDLDRHSLYFVTGHTKSKSWGIATFDAAVSERRNILVMGKSKEGNTPPFVWKKFEGASAYKSGPSPDHDLLSSTGENVKDNQCLFLRGFKISLSENTWNSLWMPASRRSYGCRGHKVSKIRDLKIRISKLRERRINKKLEGNIQAAPVSNPSEGDKVHYERERKAENFITGYPQVSSGKDNSMEEDLVRQGLSNMFAPMIENSWNSSENLPVWQESSPTNENIIQSLEEYRTQISSGGDNSVEGDIVWQGFSNMLTPTGENIISERFPALEECAPRNQNIFAAENWHAADMSSGPYPFPLYSTDTWGSESQSLPLPGSNSETGYPQEFSSENNSVEEDAVRQGLSNMFTPMSESVTWNSSENLSVWQESPPTNENIIQNLEESHTQVSLGGDNSQEGDVVWQGFSNVFMPEYENITSDYLESFPMSAPTNQSIISESWDAARMSNTNTNSPSPSPPPFSSGKLAEIDFGVGLRTFPKRDIPFHPSNVINDKLLSMVPDARVAITHDSVWLEAAGSMDSNNIEMLGVLVGNTNMCTFEPVEDLVSLEQSGDSHTARQEALISVLVNRLKRELGEDHELNNDSRVDWEEIVREVFHEDDALEDVLSDGNDCFPADVV